MSVHPFPAPLPDRVSHVEARLDEIVGLLRGLISEVQALRERIDAR